MRRRRSARLGWLLLALAAAWVYQTLQPTPPPPAAPGEATLFFLPQAGRTAEDFLIARMNEARASLEVAALELDNTRLAYALVSAAARGVPVRLYTDRDYQDEARAALVAAAHGQRQGRPTPSQETVRRTVRPLGEGCEAIARVRVCYDNRNALMHHKFVVLDGQAVWTGSANLTYNGFFRNNNDVLYLPSPPLARGYRAEFEALWTGTRRGLGRAVPFRLENAEGTAYFSPAGGEAALEAILARLAASREEVWVLAFVLTEERLIQALAAAHARGVRVRVLLETRNLIHSREENLPRGVELRQDTNPYQMHHKLMVIDRSWVITGSFNFSRSAYTRNNENLLVLHSPALAERYRKEAERLWRTATPL
ncbi:phospholipase D-like domain-containing protein [Marinithermus hydrothermalis]|uniref:phospholipase D n=1 Tax=Marinithermus hydrothermalis (strain DSM 14884 / JCM 11576 / T1) TaxID=869210 RepID=F2NLW3_MARHT|nr:phospholipase D-like domain-containing protein [Marinithermus hydrothermalis]AEB11220.1 phospholipase D/Transphosphatidylase [Marinithermus hydrothermalis DSM 14884]